MKLKQLYINWWITRTKEKYRNKYREKYSKDLRKIQEEYKEKLKLHTDKFQFDLKTEQEQHDNELKTIREQVIARKDKIIEERDARIRQLEEYIDDNNQFFNAIKDREISIENTANSALLRFQNAEKKIGDAIGDFRAGLDEITEHNRKQLSKDNKMNKKRHEI